MSGLDGEKRADWISLDPLSAFDISPELLSDEELVELLIDESTRFGRARERGVFPMSIIAGVRAEVLRRMSRG